MNQIDGTMAHSSCYAWSYGDVWLRGEGGAEIRGSLEC